METPVNLPSSNEGQETDSREESDDKSSNKNEEERGAHPQEPSQPSQPSLKLCYFCDKSFVESEFVAHLDKCAKEQAESDELDESDVQGKGGTDSEGSEHEETVPKEAPTYPKETTEATQGDSSSSIVEEEPDFESLQEELENRDK